MRRDKCVRLALSLIALLLMWPSLASAQSVVTGGLTGIVTDATGSVIAGATVNLQNQSTSEVQSTTTGTTGAYQFTLLKPGTYVLSISQTGFKQLTEKPIVFLGKRRWPASSWKLALLRKPSLVMKQGALLQTEDGTSPQFCHLTALIISPILAAILPTWRNCSGHHDEQFDGAAATVTSVPSVCPALQTCSRSMATTTTMLF